MRTLGVHIKENPFYAPYDDECWIMLAKEIMHSYSLSYISQICTTARSQAEYDKLDAQRYAPQRRSILRRIKYGPLRSVTDINAIYYAFEKHRKENLKSWHVCWQDTYTINLDDL